MSVPKPPSTLNLLMEQIKKINKSISEIDDFEKAKQWLFVNKGFSAEYNALHSLVNNNENFVQNMSWAKFSKFQHDLTHLVNAWCVKIEIYKGEGNARV